MRRTAFTLIELLVVVTVIVVLLAMLTPAIDRAVDMAERTVCLSNQKQVAGGLGYYQSDNKRTFPWGLDVPAESLLYPYSGSEPGWSNARPPQAQLKRFLANYRVFRCPSDTQPLLYNWWHYDPDTEARSIGSSYMFSERGLYGNYKALTTRNIVNSATYGYMSEGNVLPNGWTWLYADPNDPSRPTANLARIAWTHMNTVNVLYADGGVASVVQWTDADGGLKDRVREQPFSEALPQ